MKGILTLKGQQGSDDTLRGHLLSLNAVTDVGGMAVPAAKTIPERLVPAFL